MIFKVNILQFFLGFLIIFYFPIPLIGSSVIIALFFIMLNLVFNKRYIFSIRSTLGENYVIKIITSYIILILLGFYLPIFHSTYEFSILKSNFLTLFIVILGVLFYNLIVYKIPNENREKFILYFLIILYVIQTIIQILAFVSPSIKNIINLFQKENVAERDYGGIRALALTGNPFFALASGYGLAFIILIRYVIITNQYFNLRNSIYFILLFIGSFFAGRTAFIGLFLGVLYLMLNKGNFFKNFFYFFKLIIGVLFFLILIYLFLLPDSIKNVVQDDLLPFAFEMYYNYEKTGNFTTTSTDALDEMYFPIEYDTFLFGDAKFMNNDGTYYMHTDAGYMRYTLFYGIFINCLLSIIFFVSHFYRPIRQTLNFDKIEVSNLFYFGVIIIYLLLLQYKGVILFGTPLIQVMIIWCIISYSQTLKHAKNSSLR